MLKKSPILALLPFWLFVFLFKFAAGLHYTLLSPLGERIIPVWIVGIIIGAASLGQLIFDVPAGFILDRFGYIRMLTIGTGIFFLGAVALFFGLTIVTYSITIFFSFLGWLFFGPGINAYTLLQAPQTAGGRYMGIQHASASLGIVCASIALIFLIHAPAIVIGSVIALIFVLAIIAIAQAKKDHDTVSITGEKREHKSYYVRRKTLSKILPAMARLNPASAILAFQDFAGSVFYGVIWFVVPLVIAEQQSAGALSLGLGVFDLSVVLLGALLGKIADRYDKKILIFLGLFCFAAFGVFLGFSFNIIFLVLGFLTTTGDEMSSASLWSWLEELDTQHEEDGLINGVITFFDDLGWTVGPVIAGFLFETVGPSRAIAIGAIPIFASWLFAIMFLHGKNPPRPALVAASEKPTNRKPIRHRHKK